MKGETLMKKNLTIGLGIGLLTGAVIGGVAALFLAPRSGVDTRKLIGNKTNEVMDTVKETASEVSRKGQAAAFAINH